ncbi:M23 family metallopeptidase [Phytoactinopolyspora halotolerans]|uniref:M23 family metallopeptidase n=1 Tax=Phytoactinopolyspora halotolerans TaxID=1981512 RepID=A0A6L9S386_9ACTN|nr:M23 family metallopeptidase [Phytoactinopolyspora halotolerans]NED99518.1 M23 family metallopeptidase [Phytoactinopolyspora halotolerans]
MAAAASGALAMPHASGTSGSDTETIDAVPERPMTTMSNSGALDSISNAGESLTSEANETASEAHDGLVRQQRQEAAEAAARAERERKRWVSPVTASYRISAGFGSSGSMWSGTHTGVDLAAAHGAEVRAVSSGEIIFAGWDGSYGQKIAIRHWDGTVTWYGHLSRIVQASGSVEPGTVIGRVGSTGNSTGPHLHLEVRPHDGDPVNPQAWLSEQGLSL